jgi:hypothetical protein
MSKAKSGGGLTSNKLVRPEVRTGSPYKGTSPAAASQLGQSTSFRKENVGVGPAYTGSKLGNEVALNVGKGGVGTGRTVHHCGSQGTHGNVNPGQVRPKQGYDISDFGPDIPGRNYKR